MTAAPTCLTQLSQDTFADGGADVEEKSNQLQSADSTLLTADRNEFLTPRVPVRNKVFYKSNFIPVVTPPENNASSDTVRPPDIHDKGANSNDHRVCIDMLNDDSDDDMVPKKRFKDKVTLLL